MHVERMNLRSYIRTRVSDFITYDKLMHEQRDSYFNAPLLQVRFKLDISLVNEKFTRISVE